VLGIELGLGLGLVLTFLVLTGNHKGWFFKKNQLVWFWGFIEFWVLGGQTIFCKETELMIFGISAVLQMVDS